MNALGFVIFYEKGFVNFSYEKGSVIFSYWRGFVIFGSIKNEIQKEVISDLKREYPYLLKEIYESI
jgi:hypothetical protein